MEAIIPILVLAAGWLVGGMVNYLADVLPILEKISAPVCVHCQKPISWGRYFVLAACPNCQKPRSLRGFVIQIVFPLLSLLLWFYPYPRLPFGLIYLLVAYFCLVALIDLEHHLVFLSVSIAGVLICFVSGWLLHGVLASLLGGLGGAAIMLGLYWVGRLFSLWMAKKRGQTIDEEALGFGDVYVAAIIGFLLGWPGIVAGLFLGIFVGGLVSGGFLLAMLIAKRYQPFIALPYAPFLIAAAVFLIFRPV